MDESNKRRAASDAAFGTEGTPPTSCRNAITNCSFIAEAAIPSQDVADAVSDLARASLAHAQALQEMAKCLKSTPGSMGPAISITGASNVLTQGVKVFGQGYGDS